MDLKKELISFASEHLKFHKIENHKKESEWIFEHVFGKRRSIYFEPVNTNHEPEIEIQTEAEIQDTQKFSEVGFEEEHFGVRHLLSESEADGIQDAQIVMSDDEDAHRFALAVEETIRLTSQSREELDEIAETISLEKSRQFYSLVTRRSDGEPLQYIFGEWEFYGLPFKVGDGVLIPRPETELLTDFVVKKLKNKTTANTLIADLCAGSGCVGISAAKKLNAKAICADISDKAIAYLKANINLNRVQNLVEVIKGDILDKDFAAAFPFADVILVNPPYLTSAEMKDLQREVTYEPPLALFGGEDGLDFYRKIFSLYKPRLRRGGSLAVEVGDGQAARVAAFAKEAGFFGDNIKILKDLEGIERVVYADNR